MVGGLEAGWVRVVAYLVAATAALWAGWRERPHRRDNPDLWPTFWFLTAGLLLVMGLARLGDVAGWLADLGRQEALSEGWYEGRRSYQALAIALLGFVWFVAVVVVLWRVPERRRRYLPMALVMFTIAAFAGVRMISLHQADALLYRRGIAGVQFSALIELSLLVLATLATFWQPPLAATSPPPAEGRATDARGAPTSAPSPPR